MNSSSLNHLMFKKTIKLPLVTTKHKNKLNKSNNNDHIITANGHENINTDYNYNYNYTTTQPYSEKRKNNIRTEKNENKKNINKYRNNSTHANTNTNTEPNSTKITKINWKKKYIKDLLNDNIIPLSDNEKIITNKVKIFTPQNAFNLVLPKKIYINDKRDNKSFGNKTAYTNFYSNAYTKNK
jgi:hypothetical protein